MKDHITQLAREVAQATQDHKRLQSIAKPLTERLSYVRGVLQRLDSFPPSPCLVHDCGPVPAVHALNGHAVLGSSTACDICISGTDLSPKHARLESGAEGWELRCLDADGAVQVNGTPVCETMLASGDVIALAEERLIFIGQGSAAR